MLDHVIGQHEVKAPIGDRVPGRVRLDPQSRARELAKVLARLDADQLVAYMRADRLE